MPKRLLAFINPLVIIFLFVMFLPPAGANSESNESETVAFTLEQATSAALNKSKSLYSIKLSSDMTDEKLSDAEADWNPAWISDYVEGTETYYQALLTARYNVQAAAKNEEIERDSIAADTSRKYYNVLQSIKTVSQAKAELEIAQLETDIIQSQYQYGLVKLSEVKEANLSLLSAQNNLTEAENNLSSAYRSFNLLVGLDIDAQPLLTDYPEYRQIQITNVESAINKIISSSPETWLTSQNFELEKRLATFSNTSSKQNELKLEQTEIDAKLKKTNSANTLYDAYLSIISLEQGYEHELTNLELAGDALKQTELKISLGLGTNLELLKAQSNYLSQENSIFSVICQHELLKTQFEQPWAQ